MGRKPVVQYVVEELARCGVSRLLFVTGPGKTAIENHFDIDAELVAHLRQSGKEELLAELAFEREDLQYFYTRQRRQLGLGHAVLCARPVVGQQPFVVALGDSIIGLHAQSQVVRLMAEEFAARRADAVIAFEEVPREDVVQYGIAKPRGRWRRSSSWTTWWKSPTWPTPRATWPSPPATSSARRSSTSSPRPPPARGTRSN